MYFAKSRIKFITGLISFMMKIFLGDLVHMWGKGGIWTIPLNVGFVVMPKFLSCDVDTYEDLRIANAVIKSGY